MLFHSQGETKTIENVELSMTAMTKCFLTVGMTFSSYSILILLENHYMVVQDLNKDKDKGAF